MKNIRVSSEELEEVQEYIYIGYSGKYYKKSWRTRKSPRMHLVRIDNNILGKIIKMRWRTRKGSGICLIRKGDKILENIIKELKSRKKSGNASA